MKKSPKILEIEIAEPQLTELRRASRRAILRLFGIVLIWFLIILFLSLVIIIAIPRFSEINTFEFIALVISMFFLLGPVVSFLLLKLLKFQRVRPFFYDIFRHFGLFAKWAFSPTIDILSSAILRNCPFCRKRLHISKYSPMIEYTFRFLSPISFEIYCENCGSIILSFQPRKKLIRFTTYTSGIENITERDVWYKIPEERVNRKLVAKIEQLKRYIDISEVSYYYVNQDYKTFLGWYELSLIPAYPFAISPKNQIAICKTDYDEFQEIVVSLEKIIFVKYGYQGEDFYVDIGSKGLQPPKELVGVRAAHTKTSRKLYSLIENDKTLLHSIMEISKKNLVNFTLKTGRAVTSFSEVKSYLLRLNKEGRYVVTKKKPVVVEVRYTLAIGTIPVKKDFVDASRELLAKTNHI